MADQTFMFMLAAGTMIGLGLLLFVSKGLRVRSARSIENELPSTSASCSGLDEEKLQSFIVVVTYPQQIG
jgi:hypothetical protein